MLSRRSLGVACLSSAGEYTWMYFKVQSLIVWQEKRWFKSSPFSLIISTLTPYPLGFIAVESGAMTRKTWGSSHKTFPPIIATHWLQCFFVLHAHRFGRANLFGKTSSGRNKMLDMCLKGRSMNLDITCFLEIQNNLLKVMLQLANFSFRVTCLY